MRYCQSAKVTGQALYISGSKTHWLKMRALAPARHGGFAEIPRFKFFLLLINCKRQANRILVSSFRCGDQTQQKHAQIRICGNNLLPRKARL
jgi:hypothetical protein